MMWESIMEESSYEIAMDCQSYQISRPLNHQQNNLNNIDNGHNMNRRLNLDISMDDMIVEELSLFADDNVGNAITNHNNHIENDDGDDDFLNGGNSGGRHNPSALDLLLPEGSPRRFQIVRKSKQHQPSQKPQHDSNNKYDCKSMTSPKGFRVLQSLSSAEYSTESSLDDEYMELFELESFEQVSSTASSLMGFSGVGDRGGGSGSGSGFPSDLNTLITGQIIKKSPMNTPERHQYYQQPTSARRCLAMMENYSNIQQQKQQQQQQQQQQHKQPKILQPILEYTAKTINGNVNVDGLTPISTRNCYFKRPEPPEYIDCSPLQIKRYRINDNGNNNYNCNNNKNINNKNKNGDDDRENLDGSFSKITDTITTNEVEIVPTAEQQKHHHHQQQSTYNLINCNSSPILSLIRPPLRKCVSMNDAEIMSALARSDNANEPDLIGDFSKPYILPLVMNGRHRDLKSISCNTVARLLRGEFDNSVATYKIIDCRYPYEYDGGHIKGAKNLYTQEQVIEEFLINNKNNNNNNNNKKTEQNQIVKHVDETLISASNKHNNNNYNNNNNNDSNSTNNCNNGKRNIVIFHCEFSSERGPKLSRFLRNHDRARNTNSYPTLDYPEIYLLHNGYKEFYENYADLCEPHAYRPMLEPSYNEEYKHFRAKSKSWNGDIATMSATTYSNRSNSRAGGTTAQNRLQHSKKSRSRLML